MTAAMSPWVAGRAESGAETVTVESPYDGRAVGTFSWATPEQVDQAVAAAATVAEQTAAAPAYVRADACEHVRQALTARAEEFAELICAENGKPIKWARIEVARAIGTFRLAAEEARRFGGQLQRLDTEVSAAGRMAVVRRFPRGPVLGITPFNFPLNLVAHKVAPAVAVGAPVVVKPAPATPLTALRLGELLAETELPAGAFSVLPVPNDRAGELVTDERMPVVSFTGSGPVGWSLRGQVPDKHVTLELGGNAAVLVCADYRDLDRAAGRIATFGNYQAGQSCIAVQRVYIEQPLFADMVERITAAVAALGVGDPGDPDTDVGPMISADAADRLASWVDEAVADGGRVRCGGTRQGNTVAPTVLTDVPPDAKVLRDEAFGPVLVLSPVPDLDSGLAEINDSVFGLQAGVFTTRLDVAMRAHRELTVGGVIVGDVPSFRADQMPYGGVKASGVGREGVRSAMDDYTVERVLVLPDAL